MPQVLNNKRVRMGGTDYEVNSTNPTRRECIERFGRFDIEIGTFEPKYNKHNDLRKTYNRYPGHKPGGVATKGMSGRQRAWYGLGLKGAVTNAELGISGDNRTPDPEEAEAVAEF